MSTEGIKKKNKRVVVVGAGVGGIATAARLAKAGLQVSVYEKNDYYGGKCSNIVHNGYLNSSNPAFGNSC
ncbi:Phytoene desaturase [Penicillium sp. IBT 16267x]|nr:Phytoene desaturase [Penicillium sp. IBT 16267x]